MPVLTVENLTKRFGDVTANDDVRVRVGAGDVVGLLGHNGAGKTTLISQVLGLLRPDAGRIQVAGIDAIAAPALARRCVALHAQGQAPLDGLTPRLAIELAGRVRGLSKRCARERAEQLADELDIRPWLDRRALPEGRGISGGVRRLTGFAMAAVAPVSLVVLDEPTNDIDASRRRRLWQSVRRLADDGAGVLLVTHNVIEAEQAVDQLVILDHGRVVTAGTPAQLRGSHDGDLRLELRLHPGGPDPSDQPGTVPLQLRRRVRVGRRVLLTVAAVDAATAVRWASALQSEDVLEGYALGPPTLEDAYVAVTATSSGDPLDDRTPELPRA